MKLSQQTPALSRPQPGAAVLRRVAPVAGPRFGPAPPLLFPYFFFLTQFLFHCWGLCENLSGFGDILS